MPVVVDHQPLSVESLGLRTFGQVLAHLQRENRLVVRVLVDGEEPDAGRINALRQASTDQHTIFVETTEPRAMANEVLDEVLVQLDEADRFRGDAVTHLLAGDHARAMQHLSGCLGRWQHVQESLLKIAQLLRIDLTRLTVGDAAPHAFFNDFGDGLRRVKEALEDRDFVALGDALQYEMPDRAAKWKLLVDSMRGVVGA